MHVRSLKLVAEQRLERRPTPSAGAGAALGAVHPRGSYRSPGRQPGRQQPAVGTVRDAPDDDRVDVESEAEWQHEGDGSARRRA